MVAFSNPPLIFFKNRQQKTVLSTSRYGYDEKNGENKKQT